MAVLIDFDIRHLRTSGRQPRGQVKGRHRHAASALRTGHGNTDIPGVPAVRNNFIRLRGFLTLSNWLFVDGSLYHIPLHPIFGQCFCQLVQGILHRFTRNQIYNADGQKPLYLAIYILTAREDDDDSGGEHHLKGLQGKGEIIAAFLDTRRIHHKEFGVGIIAHIFGNETFQAEPADQFFGGQSHIPHSGVDQVAFLVTRQVQQHRIHLPYFQHWFCHPPHRSARGRCPPLRSRCR